MIMYFHIMPNQLQQIFIWYGDNDFEISQTLRAWMQAFSQKYTGLNLVRFDFQDYRNKDKLIDELKNSLQVNSLFGANKLIVLKNFLLKECPAPISELLMLSVEKITDGFFIIFTQKNKPDSRLKIFKFIQNLSKKGQAQIQEFSQPKGLQLNQWIKNQVKASQSQIEPGAIELLAALVGNDLWQLDAEIQKLVNYNKGQSIKDSDVKLLVKGKFNDDIFQLMDAIGHKNKKQAIKLMKDQLDSGANEMYLFTMLVRQFRLVRMVKEAQQQGLVNKDEIASEIKQHPFVVQKTIGQSSIFPNSRLIEIYSKLLEFEYSLKSKNIKFKILFDKFIAEL